MTARLRRCAGQWRGAPRVAILLSLSVALLTSTASTTAHAQSGIVLASDNFDRPDESPLVVGGNWQRSLSSGAANLAANRVSGVSGDAVYFWQGSGTFDNTRQYARARVAQTTGQLGLVLLGGIGQALVAAWSQSSGSLFLYWYANGSYQGSLTTASSTIQIGDLLEVELLDGTIYAKVNGTIVASALNTTSLTSGQPGFETFLAGGRLDDWEAGTPPVYSISGTISENAMGLSGVLVSASGAFGASTTTDANGAYAIPSVPGGATAVVLTPILAGHTLTPLARTIAGPLTGNAVGEDFTSTPSNNPVVASDNFNRAVEGSFVVGGNWQRASSGGAANLAANRVSGVSGDAVYFWQGPGIFDNARQYARARVAQKNGQLGLALLGGAGQALIAAWSNNGSGTLFIYWYTGGLYQGNLAVGSSTLQVGDLIEAELLDGTVYAKVNGTIVASAVNTTSLTAGRPGFETYLTGGGLDDWEAGTSTAYSISGTISENAVGLSGVLVSASGTFGATTTTDVNGAYSIPSVPGGATAIVLTPILAGHTPTPLTRTVVGPVTGNVVGENFTSTPSSNSVVAADNFDRAAETPLVVGGNWQRALNSGAAQLAGNRVSGISGEAVYYWQGVGTFDDSRQYARARVAQTNGQVGLVLLGGNGHALVAAWSNDFSGTFRIFWYTGGVNQGNLTTTPSPLQVGDLIEAELIDGRVYAKVNGTIVASTVNTTSLTSGRPGFETFPSAGGLDDWEAGTPPAYSISGTISENAAGLSTVYVSASGGFGASTTTDANGAYSIPSVPGGATAIVLTPILAGHTLSPLTRTLAGPVTGNIVGQNFTSTPSSSSLVAADNFNRAAESPFVVGGNWQRALSGGGANLTGNRVVGATNDAVYFWQGPGIFGNTRQYARARVTQTTGQVGLVLLGGSGQALVAAWSNNVSGTFYIYRYIGGVNQGNLTTATSSLQVGDVIEAELTDGTINARVNGTIVASVANTTPLTSGRPGFETYLTGGGLDDWEAGTSLAVLVACNDGLDNDGDGLVDLADPGCLNAADTSELNASVACDDGLDNDADSLIDLADPGCVNAADPSEQNATVACDDGLDNDGDALVDLSDPGCANAADASEQNAALACDDGLDNDGDALVDLADPGCANAADTSEQNATSACDDGLDNDGDALIDLADPGCANVTDPSEQNATLACDDGLDNDGDALVDLADPGCANSADNSEHNTAVACDDGLDNDGDNLIDWPADPGCTSATDTSEASTAAPVPTLPPLGLLALFAALLVTAGIMGARVRRSLAG